MSFRSSIDAKLLGRGVSLGPILVALRKGWCWVLVVMMGVTAVWGQSVPSAIPDLQLADGGFVICTAQQDDGKLIIAGRFSDVNGIEHRNLARINPDGTVDGTWSPLVKSPDTETDYGILAMQLVGTDLYIAGTFNAIGDLPRAGLAKISTLGAGEADPTWNPHPTAGVFAMTTDGLSLYVGGRFNTISGVRRLGIAKLALDGTGAADSTWNPTTTNLDGSGVTALTLDGSTLYVAERVIGTTATGKGDLFRISATGTGELDTTWHPSLGVTDFYLQVIVVSTTDVYAGGYSYVSTGSTRAFLVKCSVTGSGVLDTTWQPNIHGTNDADLTTQTGVEALALDGDNLYVGGYYASIAGAARVNLAKISATSPVAVDSNWSADASISSQDTAGVRSLTVSGGQLLTAGAFRQIGESVALGIASLDLVAGGIIPIYQAQAEFPPLVSIIVPEADGKLIVGGRFFLAGGLPRHGLVRVNLDGSVDGEWNPASEDSLITDIVVQGNDIFVSGTFTTMGGQPRNGLAKLSAIGPDTADPSWNPNVNGYVGILAAAEPLVYIGGSFTTVGGTAQYGLARVSATGTGALDASWRPFIPTKRDVTAILPTSNSVYVGTELSAAGGEGVAMQKLSLTSAAPDPSFTPPIRADVESLATDGTWIYAGGYDFFTRVDPASGAKDPAFNVVTNNYVDAVALGATEAYIGGLFNVAGGLARPGLARVNLTGAALGKVDPTWNPTPQHSESGRPGHFGYYGIVPAIYDVFVEGDTVYAGGEYDTIGAEPRFSFAELPVAHAPVMVQTSNGIVITENPLDGIDVAYFEITRVTGGTLYLSDGVTPVQAGDFITVAQGAAGLIFQATPIPNEYPRITAVSALEATPGGAGTATAYLFPGLTVQPTVFELDEPSYTVDESSGALTVNVLKVGSGSGSVQVATSDGSAVAGTDYTPINTTLTFGAQDTSMPVVIPITNSPVFRGDRAFTVTLAVVGTGAALGEPASSPVEIIDNNIVGSTASLTSVTLPNPVAPPASQGQLSIMLTPAAANGQWRPVGDPQWYDSGAVVSGLTTGNYAVEFQQVNGYQPPAPYALAVISGSMTSDSAVYTALPGGAVSGTLQVILKPNVAVGAQWQCEGETVWHNSGDMETLNSGVYTVVFNQVSGFIAPAPQTVNVPGGQTSSVIGLYYVAPSNGAATPSALTLSEATTQTPYLFNGQIVTEQGYGSGVVVQTHSVLTAAHVLFNDETLSNVESVSWFYQRERGQYEPSPTAPRGWYLYDGYAAERAADGAQQSPDISTPTSQDLDVATMFFLEPAGRGGVGGYLASDADQNPWLTGGLEAMLVGYPVESVPNAEFGTMYATTPTALAFTNLYGTGQRVFSTTAIAGYPGMSGGPLYAKNTDGNYYPAAVFLGGSGQTLVRAIDSQVVNLINRAEYSSGGGGNDVGGGTVVVVPGLSAGGFALGTLACNLGSTAAISAGAGWQIAGETTFSNSSAPVALPAGNYTVRFNAVPGYITPTTQLVAVTANQETVVDGYYAPAAAVITSARHALATTNAIFKYQITAANNPTSYGAANLPAGLTVNSQTGQITGTAQTPGVYQAAISATNSVGTNSAPLTITVEEPGLLTVNISGLGQVTPGYLGTSVRYVGQHYAIAATPAPGMIFDGWSGDVPTATPRLTFTMQDGLELWANFIPNPFLTTQGGYDGLVSVRTGADLLPGIASANITSAGAFTLALQFGAKRYGVKGTLNTSGYFDGFISRGRETALEVQLQLNLNTAVLNGTMLEAGTTAATFTGLQAATVQPVSKRYTFTLPHPSNTALPQGDGYGTVTLDRYGVFHFSGALGDGTALAASSRLSTQSTLPLFASAYSGGGYVTGVLTFENLTGSDFDGALTWLRPKGGTGAYAGGFGASVNAEGAVYASLHGFTQATVTIGGGQVTGPMPEAVMLTTHGGTAVFSSGKFRFSVSTASGLFSGAFPAMEGTKAVEETFAGALLQKAANGGGVFRGATGATGFVELSNEQ